MNERRWINMDQKLEPLMLSARHHAAESGEAPLPLSDQWVRSQVQQAAVVWNKHIQTCSVFKNIPLNM